MSKWVLVLPIESWGVFCKMKFSILGFNQQKCLQLTATKEVKGKDGPKNVDLRLDVTDLLILRTVADFMNRAKIRKVIIEDKMYCWVKYATIIEDLPILGIKQQALTDRLDKMVTFNLLEKQVEHTQLGTFSYFRVGKKYEDLLYDKDDATSSEAQDRTCSEIPEGTSSQLQVHNSNIYNNPSTNNSSTIKESKEDKSSFKKDVDFLEDLPKEDKPKRQPKAIKRSNWRGDYEEYKAIVDKACDELLKDDERKKKVLQLYPSADYQRTVIKWYQYWSSEQGWNTKKKGTTNTINMFLTFDRTFERSIVNVNNTISSPPPRKEVIQDGEWADGTYVLGGYRYYNSPKTGQRTSVAMNAPIRPNEWAEYDYKSNNWITPIERDNGIFW